MLKESADLVHLKTNPSAKQHSNALIVFLSITVTKLLVLLEKMESQLVSTNKSTVMMVTNVLKTIAIPKLDHVFTMQSNLENANHALLTLIVLNGLLTNTLMQSAKLHSAQRTSAELDHPLINLNVLFCQSVQIANLTHAKLFNVSLEKMVYLNAFVPKNLAMMTTNVLLINVTYSLDIASIPSYNPVNALPAKLQAIAINGLLTINLTKVASSQFVMIRNSAKHVQQAILPSAQRNPPVLKMQTAVHMQQRTTSLTNVSLHIATMEHANPAQLMI
jgi:hypothetical protein